MPPKGWKSVSMKELLLKKLEAIAKTKEITRSSLMHMVLWQYVDKHEVGD